jgi:hypothetical protein
MTTAGAVAGAPLPAGALFPVGCSCEKTVAPKQTTIARDKTTRLIVKNPFNVFTKSEVQSHLSIDATITSAGAAATATTKGTEQSSHVQRLTKTGRGKITNRRAKINVIQDVLEIEGDVESVLLLTRSSTAAAGLWTTRPRTSTTAGR